MAMSAEDIEAFGAAPDAGERLDRTLDSFALRVFRYDYERKLGHHLARRFRKVWLVRLSDYAPFYNAWKSGVPKMSGKTWRA